MSQQAREQAKQLFEIVDATDGKKAIKAAQEEEIARGAGDGASLPSPFVPAPSAPVKGKLAPLVACGDP